VEGDACQPVRPDRLAEGNLRGKEEEHRLLIGGNDGKMDEETRAWYDAHRQDILRPPSTASSSPSTSTPAAVTPAADDASPPDSPPDKAQKGTADEPVII
jgi:hypothetical protein